MEKLIRPSGNYRKLLSYQKTEVIYEMTYYFCQKYLQKGDRTVDQMVQAARSGVANIIEGSEASATSKKTELKLTNVAKASQEELLSDYQAFLRQRGLPEWTLDSTAIQTLRQVKPETLDQLRELMAALVADPAPGVVRTRTDKAALKAEVAGNVMIALIKQETYLLERQIARLAADFEQKGGFTERLYRIRTEVRKKGKS